MPQPLENLMTRSVRVRNASVNEQARTVEAVLSTEEPVTVFDWDLGYIDEVLISRGVQASDQMPLLNAHARWSVDDMLGSIRDIKSTGSGEVVGTLHFATGVPAAETAWTLVRQGHITDVSVGYGYEGERSYVDIKPGQTAVIEGKSYTAKERTLRVVTRWPVREGSLVPIGADERAKLRAAHNQGQPPSSRKEVPVPNPTTETQTTTTTTQQTQTPPATQPDTEAIRARAVTDERARVLKLREMAGDDVPADTLEKAINEGWSARDAGEHFLVAARAARKPTPPLGTTQQAAGQQQRDDAAVLEAALCLNISLPEKVVVRTIAPGDRERIMNTAMSGRYRGSSLHMLMDSTLAADGQSYHGSRKSNEFIRAAMYSDRSLRSRSTSTLSLSGILSNVANKVLISSYESVETVFRAFCAIRNHADFKVQTRYRLDATGSFKKVANDGELKHVGLDEAGFTASVDTFGAIMSLTRKMMWNDDLGAFAQIQQKLGQMSAIRVEEGAFVLLLSNLDSFFHTNNRNLLTGGSSALSIASLAAAEQLFMDQVDSNNKPILVTPKFILTGSALKSDAQNIFDEKVITASTDKVIKNKMFNKYPPTGSPYVNNTAIRDQDGKAITGQSATKWWMFADPNVRAAVVAAFLNGQQTPTVESAEADFNVLGMQFRAYHDFGFGMEEPTAAVQSNGV